MFSPKHIQTNKTSLSAVFSRLLKIFSRLFKIGLTGLGIILLTLLFGWMLQPEMDQTLPGFNHVEVSRARALRKVGPGSEKPPRRLLEVDYSEGRSASWWPRGEAPILVSAVQSGRLPPVAERVGSEPMVLGNAQDGIGKYGGTWNYVAASSEEYKFITYRLGAATLLRWSPYGYPIVPNVARAWEVRNSNREFVFHLRKGMKWSDGAPLTTGDIRYWWEEEVADPDIFGRIPEYLIHHGKPPVLEIVDETTFIFRYEDPHTLLPEILATSKSAMAERGMLVPSHYLKQFHPRLGDPEKIARLQESLGLSNPRMVYLRVKEWDNPECPRLWPWIYRTYKPDSPQGFVRNPYYFAVDEAGNQLPYVDRLLMTLMSPELTVVAAANGETTLQFEQIRFDNYTHLMEQRERNGYEVLHWYAGNASPMLIYPNLNRRFDPEDPIELAKNTLVHARKFRQALSLAINRKQISRAEYSELAQAEQLAPVEESPLYVPALTHAFTKYDPERAAQMFNELGLNHRDAEGFRTLPGGERLQFFMHVPNNGNSRIARWVCADWENAGLRVTLREQDVKLFMTQLNGGLQDFTGWSMNGKIYDLIEPKNFVASSGSYYAQNWGLWFSQGGLLGVDAKNPDSAYPPPPDHHMMEAMRLTEAARIAPDRAQQVEIFKKVLGIASEELWEINVLRQPFVIAVVKDDFRNVPRGLFFNWDFMSPFNGAPELFYLDNPENSPGAVALLEKEVVSATPLPGALSTTSAVSDSGTASDSAGALVAVVLHWAFGLTLLLALLLVALRHRFIARRLIIMVPTLVVVSICAFIIIQLPEGDYLDSYIAQLRISSDENFEERIEDMRQLFHLDETPVQRYCRWVGLTWFTSFKPADKGLLQGYLGRSMETLDSVNRLVGERILLTVIVTTATIFFTWMVALPIGIFSAVRQHSIGDYAATATGLIGMCIPNFLFALLLMFAASRWFDTNITGLFSADYVTQPEWSWGKVMDLLRHLWIPVVVIGLTGTAAMARLMRSNLLDELRRPYVTTARAKGVRPLKLLLKYPVRLAVNPFISALGGLFPQFLSGGTIVAMVLSLPLVGPQLLTALMKEDMYLAGSLLMVMSVLGLLGTLISDLLLLWLDPRIRIEGGRQ